MAHSFESQEVIVLSHAVLWINLVFFLQYQRRVINILMRSAPLEPRGVHCHTEEKPPRRIFLTGRHCIRDIAFLLVWGWDIGRLILEQWLGFISWADGLQAFFPFSGLILYCGPSLGVSLRRKPWRSATSGPDRHSATSGPDRRSATSGPDTQPPLALGSCCFAFVPGIRWSYLFFLWLFPSV